MYLIVLYIICITSIWYVWHPSTSLLYFVHNIYITFLVETVEKILSLPLFLFLFLSLPHSLPLFLCLSLSISDPLSLCLYLTLSLCLSLTLSLPPLSLSISPLSLSISDPLSPSPLSIYLSPLSLSIYLWPSLSLSVYFLCLECFLTSLITVSYCEVLYKLTCWSRYIPIYPFLFVSFSLSLSLSVCLLLSFPISVPLFVPIYVSPSLNSFHFPFCERFLL